MSELTNENSTISQKITDEAAASAVFCETIAKQNKVILNFCSSLLSQSLNTVAKLNFLEAMKAAEMASADEIVRTSIDEFQKKVFESIQQQITQEKPSPEANQSKTPLGNNVEDIFVNSMAASMQNVLKAQEELYALAKSATLFGITSVYALDTVKG